MFPAGALAFYAGVHQGGENGGQESVVLWFVRG